VKDAGTAKRNFIPYKRKRTGGSNAGEGYCAKDLQVHTAK